MDSITVAIPGLIYRGRVRPGHITRAIMWLSLATILILLGMSYFETGGIAKGFFGPVILASIIFLCALLDIGLSHNAYFVRMTSPKGYITIRKDKKYDAIVNLITSSRVYRIRELYNHINLNNDPLSELGKFDYLKSQNIISIQEYDDAVKKIKEHHSLLSDENGIKSPGHFLN